MISAALPNIALVWQWGAAAIAVIVVVTTIASILIFVNVHGSDARSYLILTGVVALVAIIVTISVLIVCHQVAWVAYNRGQPS